MTGSHNRSVEVRLTPEAITRAETAAAEAQQRYWGCQVEDTGDPSEVHVMVKAALYAVWQADQAAAELYDEPPAWLEV